MNFQYFSDAIYVIYQLLEMKDNIQVVFQIPCLLGHPIRKRGPFYV